MLIDTRGNKPTLQEQEGLYENWKLAFRGFLNDCKVGALGYDIDKLHPIIECEVNTYKGELHLPKELQSIIDVMYGPQAVYLSSVSFLEDSATIGVTLYDANKDRLVIGGEMITSPKKHQRIRRTLENGRHVTVEDHLSIDLREGTFSFAVSSGEYPLPTGEDKYVYETHPLQTSVQHEFPVLLRQVAKREGETRAAVYPYLSRSSGR